MEKILERGSKTQIIPFVGWFWVKLQKGKGWEDWRSKRSFESGGVREKIWGGPKEKEVDRGVQGKNVV